MPTEKLNSIDVPVPYEMWCYLNQLAGILDIELHKAVLELCELGKSTAESITVRNFIEKANTEKEALQKLAAQAALEALLVLRKSNLITQEALDASSSEAKEIIYNLIIHQNDKQKTSSGTAA
ncbi:MAG: hypothetical protein U1E78_13005 [Gammaproteobacteria bacterium]